MQPGCATSSGKGLSRAGIAAAPLERVGLAKNSLLPTLRASSSEQWFQLGQIGNVGSREVYSLTTNSNRLRCSQWLSDSKSFLRKGAVGAVLSAHLFMPYSWQNSFPVYKLPKVISVTKNSTLKTRDRPIRWLVVNLSGVKTLTSRFPVNWMPLFPLKFWLLFQCCQISLLFVILMHFWRAAEPQMNSSQIPGNFCVFLFIWFWYGMKKILVCKKTHFQQENMCSWVKSKNYFTLK